MAATNVQAFSGDVEISSNLAVDTNTLFVDSVGGTVGIGKTDPGVALDVAGDVEISSNLAVDTDTLFVDSVGGTVGIGKTDPEATLDVDGTVAISSNLSVGTTTFNACPTIGRVGIGTTNPETNFHIYSGGYLKNNYIHKFLGNGPEQAATYVLLLKNDNTPKSLSGKVYGVRGSSSVSTNFGATLYVSVTTNGTIDARMTFEHIGAASFYCKLVTLTYDSGSYIALALLPTINYRGVSGGIYFDGKLTSGDDLQYITDLGTLSNITDYTATNEDRVTFTGNVGIGTTGPSSQLELYGAGKDLTFKNDTGISRRSAATRDGYYSGFENSIKRVGDRNLFDGSLFTPDTTHEILFGFSDTYTQWSGNDEYYPSYNEMRFKLWSPTSSIVGSLTDVMTLRGDGNVGIGTTNPGAKLSVESTGDTSLRITSGSTSNSRIEFGDTDDNSTAYIDYDNNNNLMTFQTNGGNRMRIDSAGKTTIGPYVASPRFLLDIPAYYSPNNLGLVIHGGSGGSTNESGTCGIGFNPRYRKSHVKNGILCEAVGWGRGNLHFCIRNTVGSGAEGDIISLADSKMMVRYDGNVGIGTDNPDRALHVNSSSCRFGNFKFNSGFAAQPADTSTGVNMKGFNAGGGVLFVMTFHNGSGDGTATRVVFLRKTYDATWTQKSSNTTQIIAQHSTSTQDGTLTFDTSSDILRYRYSKGGNSHFYVIEFDG
jgi:hypothetical protein